MTDRLPALRRYSQNFLVDRRVADRIVAVSGAASDRAVLEIGPGRGALTAGLAERARRLRVVEVDRGLAWALAEQYATQAHVDVRVGDVLALGLGALLVDDERWLVVSNLPYGITTPILFAVLAEGARIEAATFMVQREVAERLEAEPGTAAWGALAVQVQRRALVERLFDVGPDAFRPRPRVVSTVLRVEPLAAPRVPVREEALFDRVVRAVFAQRRKTLRNALGAAGFAPAEIEAVRALLGGDLRVRGETLSVAELAAVADAVAGVATEA